MKRRILVLMLFFACTYLKAQQNPAVVDSFKLQLSKAQTSEQKIDVLSKLSRVLMNNNIPEAEIYAAQMLREAEISRDRRLMVKALLSNGERYSYFAFKSDYIQKSIDFYNRALELARQNDLQKEYVKAYLGLSSVYTKLPNLDGALNYATKAFSIASTLKDDTLTVATYNSFGTVYQLRKERILALRNYLNALRVSEESKRSGLLRTSYSHLANFYADIKDYDKSIDFLQKSLDELPNTGIENKLYLKVVDYFSMGNLYVMKKNYDMSLHYFEKSIQLADSLKYAPLKTMAYQGIMSQYMLSGEPQKALDYFNTHPELKNYIKSVGVDYMVDNMYAYMYTELGKYDSARYYYRKAAPFYESVGTADYKMSFYTQYADFFKKSGATDSAIAYLQRARTLADGTANLEWQEKVALELDSVYAMAGDFRQARLYGNLHHKYKDSLQKLSEEKDLLQIELQDEEQREARRVLEKEAALRERHNIQYMGITIAIALVFTLLVLMGAFRVSEVTIKIMGFFAFIFLFEFIILIADNKIHHLTHGEPLPILGIKIILIAMLLPLHHWLEHKVVHYLASRRLIIPTGKSLWTALNPMRKKEKKASDFTKMH